MKIKKTKGNFENYDYNSTMPIYCDPADLTERHKELLTKSKVFCILPWIHMHAFPDGRAYPCCLGEMWQPVGDLRKNTMAEVWNDTPYKTMRTNMLEEKPCKECTKCYELEDNGFFSMRNSFSKDFGHLVELTDATNDDGSLDDFKLRYYDVRFSNLCNFRCRTCGPIFSSNWYNDHIKLYGKKPDVLGREMASVEYAGRHKYDIWEQMQEHIPNLEQIYFAGGEPLIMEEHYMILKELVARKLFHVRLIYNTNFSVFKYKDQDVFELWKLFDSVSVGASLDDSGARGEYIRKGQDWAETEASRRRMMEVCPRVDFYVSSTVSLYNVWHVSDFHRDWTDKGLVRAQDWNINLCQSPDRDRADVLPQIYKDEIIAKIEKHLEWLEPLDTISRATGGYRGIINFLKQQDNTQHLGTFFKDNDLIDNVREEKFEEVFPEYKDLRSYVR
jgi:organic radical activating enzyme